LSTAPYIFDSFVLEIYSVLFVGASLFVVKDEQRKDVNFIYNYCFSCNITNIFLTAKLAEEFLIIENEERYLKNLTLIVGGEAFSVAKSYKYTIVNEYGPTENTVCTTKFKIIQGSKNVYIGKPISNSKCYVLDRDLNPLPIGAVGELYIGGVGLARGYLNRPDLTAERFILNPFQTRAERDNKHYGICGKNARLYRTGDLVRWLSDGNLEYIGRNDFQVKIRGYRIELGEIEAILSSYNGIKQSVVLAKEHINSDNTTTGNKYLVGYYVAVDRYSLNQQEILNYLQAKLPEYMVPNILIELEKLPLTLNGKLDRKALPDPEFTNIESYIAPRNELEQKLCEIWSEILGLAADKVSIHDDFFRLGGDSISAIKLVNKINKTLNINISISFLFKYKSIITLFKELKLVKEKKECYCHKEKLRF
jgi:acyl-coenzyme A synthetase/AMP-(fatty) acid ligase/acyl carrier protein